MTRSLILTLVAGSLAICGSSLAAPSRRSPARTASAHCGPAAAHTLAASSRVRVYSQGGSVYGCAPRAGRQYRLGSATVCNDSARVGPVAVAGALAGYALQRCGVDTGTTVVEVRRFSDGRQLFSHAAIPPAGVESFDSVGSLVINAGAAVAWIGHASSIATHRSVTQVFAFSGAGVRRLDSGPGILTGSLRLAGSKLSWRHGASTRSAKLG